MRVLFCFFFFTFNLISFAQEKVAILIANEAYTNLNNLKNPLNDVFELERICKENKYDTHIFKNLSKVQFENLIDSLHFYTSSNTKKLYIHYAGHGIQVDQNDYFVPVDFPKIEMKSELSQKCVRLSDLFDKLNDMAERNSGITGLITLDACRKFPLSVGYIEKGFSIPTYNQNLYNHFSLIYAVGPNQSAMDGQEKISPFISAISHGFADCRNLADIIYKINIQYNKAYQDPNVKPNLITNVGFSFCDLDNSNNWHEEYIELINGVDEDFQREFYGELLNKAALADKLINHEKVSINRESIQYLTYKYQKAIAFYELGQINDSRFLLEELAVLKINGNNWELFNEATFHLAQIYTKLGDFDSLLALRNKQLSYLMSVKNNVSIALTFDKIAGDYEERAKRSERVNYSTEMPMQELQDSSLKYYFKALKVIESCDLSEGENKQLAGIIYSNLGNCLRYGNGKDLIKSKIYLGKALECCNNNNELKRKFLFDLLSIDTEKVLSETEKKSFEDNLHEHLVLCRNSKSKTHLLEHFDIALTYHKANNDVFAIKSDFDSLQRIVFSDLKFNILTDTVLHESYAQNCENVQRKIKIELPVGILPVLFFDKNRNRTYDSFDYRISPENATLEKNYPCILGLDKREQVIRYETTPVAQSTGIFYLHHNNKHLSDMISKESFCVAIPNGETVIWDFRINCNELNVNVEGDSKSSNYLFIGARYVLVKDESNLISTENILRFTPIYPFNKDCKNFSLSTYDNN